jgi:curli biogenesis system outer membrane secretion channel CsgG
MRRPRSVKVLAVLLGVLTTACRPAAVDKQALRAPIEPPESTRVGLVRIPYDPSLPYFVVTIEPFTFDANAAQAPSTPGTHYGWGPSGWGLWSEGPRTQAYDPPAAASGQMGNAIASQLVTALGNAGNIRILDYEYYWNRREHPATLVRRNAGEVGPFVIRGSVTEFNEIAAASGSSRGSVAMDLYIIDPTNGRVGGTVNANGSFTTESGANGFSLFGFGKASNAFPASVNSEPHAVNSATKQCGAAGAG